ncbi:MAG: hypothetical protein RMM28_05470 [Thermoleophilia bacterium]|nr:hypothetical protein [Gaiellaceae bacterium]MDW8338570.1 hypothetical protein [Thermoleophilia bacterium]
MDRALGLLLLAVYIVAIVGLAALVTFVVIKLFPTERTPKKEGEGEERPTREQRKRSDGRPAGRLYRRAKRGAA